MLMWQPAGAKGWERGKTISCGGSEREGRGEKGEEKRERREVQSVVSVLSPCLILGVWLTVRPGNEAR